MAEDFTLDGHGDLLRAFLDRGYAAVGYERAEPAARHLILRHDLDMSIQAALRIAKVEAALGMAGSYFVLLRTELYNPWSEANRADLRAIADMGHEIGLHLDASHYGSDDDALEAACARECTVLESIVETPVTTVSFHRPAKALQGRAGTLAGRRHAYEPRFFSQMGYCSDSRGDWHHEHPLAHPAVAEARALQLLTHPIWWAGSVAGDPVTTLDAFRHERDGVMASALAANCEPYRDAYGTRPKKPI